MILHSSTGGKKIKCVATIGAFDGVHRGHLYLLKQVLDSSRTIRLASVLITFWPLPSVALNKNPHGFLTDLEQKIKIIKDLGFDHFLILKTDSRLLQTEGEDFFKKIARNLDIKKLIVGEDFRFGRGAKKNAISLKQISLRSGFSVDIVKKRKYRGAIISSSFIRRALAGGDLKKVKAFLGRNYLVIGKRIRGKGIGTQIGYPTVNLDLGGFVVPANGVYAVRVFSGTRSFLGACSVGENPTLQKNKKIRVEIHLLHYFKTVLKERLGVEFLEYIRPQRRFSSLAELTGAISRDIHHFILPKYSR
ncbi:MAG: riboflavin biosynthesis protein RibF [Candidatus Omnitrophica bacterium]|nr:riboflavin biosynthesis protein RibF [Candidatus Omnitrophota bacterium]